MTFNKNTAPLKYSKVRLYVVLYNAIIKIDINVVNIDWTEFIRPNGKIINMKIYLYAKKKMCNYNIINSYQIRRGQQF